MRLTAFNAPLALSIVATIASIGAYANDTSAVLGAGGLQLTSSADIAMTSEDLYLSPSEVHVRYTFRNEASHEIKTTVAFPLPDVDQNENEIVFLPTPDQENFVDFRVSVDGQPVQPKLEQKAVANDGVDVTDIITKAGLPLNSKIAGWKERVRALPDDVWQRLVRQRLLDLLGNDPKDRSAEFTPTWTLKVAFHWEQIFPAGKTIIVDHRYKPIIGGISIFADDSQFQNYGRYCLDDQGRAGVQRLLKQAHTEARKKPQTAAGISPTEVSYVLTTGANWKGPIEDFHLTIDKERPDSVLSLCMGGLTKTGPTTFELRKTNFTPMQDIKFVVFQK